MIVKLESPNPHYGDLTSNQSYVVIGIEADDLRLLNGSSGICVELDKTDTTTTTDTATHP